MILSHGIADSIQIYIIHRICWLGASVVQHPFICFFIQKHTILLDSFQSIWLYQSIRPTCWIDSWISKTFKSKFKSIKILLTPAKSDSFLLSSSHSIPAAWSRGHWPVWASNIGIVIVVTLRDLDRDILLENKRSIIYLALKTFNSILQIFFHHINSTFKSKNNISKRRGRRYKIDVK